MTHSNSLAFCLLALLAATVDAQTMDASVPATSPPTTQTYPQPIDDVSEGFLPLFDGKSLDGWDGDPTYWRVEDGAIVGEVTPDTVLQRNSFLIWRGGHVRDFELVVEYRITAGGNSGINYRSEFVPHGDAPWAMRGYQADIDGSNRYTGQNYEERGRTFLAKRGDVTRATAGAERALIASVGAPDELATSIRKGDWNTYHIIARGVVLTHILNGRVMSVVIDNDQQHRKREGLLGVQVHTGPPMKVEFRSIRVKHLEP